MAKEIRRIDGSRRTPSRPEPLYERYSPLVDGTPLDEYIGGRHRSEYVDHQSPALNSAFLLERDLQDLKSNIIEACSSLAAELVDNKLSKRFRIDI